MYFSHFPTSVYDMKKDGNVKLVTDIFRRIKIREKIINEVSLYEPYFVPNGESPETTAFKHFGSAEFHWVILLTNNIMDRYYEWPLSDADFERFVNDKYSNPDAVHHYEITRSSGKTTGDGPDDFSHKIEVNSTVSGAEAVTNRQFEDRKQDKLRKIKLLNPQFLNAFLDEFETLISR